MNILLIEDTKSHSDFIMSILLKNSHKVKLIINGKLAFDYLLNPSIVPDVIIIDNFLPSMTGLEIIEYFINNNYNYAFIILTSGQSIDLAVKGMKVGALEYVQKSIEISNELELIIEKAYKTNQGIILRKTLEKNLKESEEGLKRQYQNLPFPTYTWEKTTDGFILIDYNYAAIKITQGGIKKLIGEKFNKIFANYPDILKKIMLCYTTHENQVAENYYTFMSTGIKRFLKSTYVFVPDNMIMVHIEDITERKHAEIALMESEKQLRDLNVTKDKFFSILAHDLKSPFNTMLGFSKLLVDDFDNYDVKKQKKFIGVINQDIKKTYKLLENLLIWSQSQRGIIDFKPEKQKLYLLAAENCELLFQSAAIKSIKIINRVADDVYVKADKNMLLTILRNLISNAIKFTPKGGMVEIGCFPVETHSRVSQYEKDRAYQHEYLQQIYVKDNGVGIEKEKISQLFGISESILTKGTEGESGTGLGLILCREFVEKHGGKIWVESEVGKGSEFIFTLSA